jgi:hypothetical protein
MTRDELLNKWAEQAEQMRRRQIWVSGAELCLEFLEDFHRVELSEQEAVLTLRQAADISGYSRAHLGRLVRDGKLRTLRPPGSKGHLTFRRFDLPQKPKASNTARAGRHDLASRLLGGKEANNGRS